MASLLGFLTLALVPALTACPAIADDEPPDPEALRPGLVAEFRDSIGEPDRGRSPFRLGRVARSIVEHWEGGAPDPRLTSETFSASFRGWLLIRDRGPHRFLLSGDGPTRLVLDGDTILEAPGGSARSSPIELSPGLVPLRIDSEHRVGDAHLILDWEGPGFDVEHVPPHLLFHEARLAPPVDRFEQGRRLADRLGCASCHSVLDMPAHPSIGPPLDLTAGLSPDWLHSWLLDPPSTRPGTPMPGFGLEPSQAADLSAFLASVSGEDSGPDREGQMALNVADAGRGRLLFRSAGCLACHARGESGAGEPTGIRPAPDLDGLGRKRTFQEVSTYLGGSSRRDPGRHRPTLGLTVDAAAHLAAYLTSPEPDQKAAADIEAPRVAGDPERGRTLAVSIGCASCHEIPGLRPSVEVFPLSRSSDPDSGCLAEEPPPGTPRFGLSEEERMQLRAFVTGIPDRPSPMPSSTLAEDHLRSRNCLGCHSRYGSGGEAIGERLAALLAEDRELNTLKGTLTPPDLSSVGAKLRPEALDLAMRGEAPVARPWLSVRMPRYDFEPGEAERIASHFRRQDRVIDAPPHEPSPPTLGAEVGITLLGRDGFGCVSCHVVSGRIPPGGEAETLGPDLALAHRRMNRSYYDRWLKNPQRIIPGTPMPQFLMPAPGIDGSLDEQLGAIWDALGDDRLAERTSTASRQVLDRPDDRDLVVRDMIVVPDAPNEYYPRGLAIGLRDDHALLFDADRLSWVRWWDRGFLYRTKQGRLWEWHPEGRLLWVAEQPLPPVVFRDAGGRIVLPDEIRGRFGSFAELSFEPEGIRLRYELNGPEGGSTPVVELIRSRPDGWERHVSLGPIPDGMLPMVVAATGRMLGGPEVGVAEIEGATVRVRADRGGRPIVQSIGPEESNALLVPGTAGGKGTWECRLRVQVIPAP